MLINDQRIRGAVAGAIGGGAGWLLVEPLVAPRLGQVYNLSGLYSLDAQFGALAGICIGAALGIAEGVLLRSAYRAGRGGAIGAGAGLIGGAVGLVIGEMFYQPLKVLCFVGRAIGWAVFGVFLGLAEGITRRSLAGLRSAALGGLIGGAIGGFMFDAVGAVTQVVMRSDAMSRAVALVIMGACIGIWIVVMERSLSPATVKVTSGRLEGREYYLDKPRLTLGSDERGDIAIYDDPQIQPQHAVFESVKGGYEIRAEPGAAVQVNKQPVARQALAHGDELLVGRTRLIYRLRSASAERLAYTQPALPQPSLQAPPPPPPLVPQSRPPAWQTPAAPQVPPPPIGGAAVGAGTLWLVDVMTGRRYPLGRGVTTIGRAGDNMIVLDQQTVSGYHAEVRYEDGRYILIDRGSSNGTFVNGRALTGPNLIKAGWQVTLGQMMMRVEG